MVFYKKFIFAIASFVLFLMLVACPGHENCNDLVQVARVENLLSITPLKSTYNKGDVVTLKATLPSVITSGNTVNLFALTNDYSAFLVLAFDQLFINNQLTFVKGSQGADSNWFEVPYNATTENYELEIKVKLNKTGQYNFVSSDSFDIQGKDYCNRYRIDSNIESVTELDQIIFNVQP